MVVAIGSLVCTVGEVAGFWVVLLAGWSIEVGNVLLAIAEICSVVKALLSDVEPLAPSVVSQLPSDSRDISWSEIQCECDQAHTVRLWIIMCVVPERIPDGSYRSLYFSNFLLPALFLPSNIAALHRASL